MFDFDFDHHFRSLSLVMTDVLSDTSTTVSESREGIQIQDNMVDLSMMLCDISVTFSLPSTQLFHCEACESH